MELCEVLGSSPSMDEKKEKKCLPIKKKIMYLLFFRSWSSLEHRKSGTRVHCCYFWPWNCWPCSKNLI